jgi:hypothetical protein
MLKEFAHQGEDEIADLKEHNKTLRAGSSLIINTLNDMVQSKDPEIMRLEERRRPQILNERSDTNRNPGNMA